MSLVVVLTKNLMDASRVQAAASDAVAVHSLDEETLAEAELILFDLTSGFDPAAVAAIGPPVIAYGPHVDREALDAAVAAGCREALPRSLFFRRLGELVEPD